MEKLSLIRKVVIPAAGLGTRLLSVTKEMPKEMLPVFAKDLNGKLRIKPILQVIFEKLYGVGFREFCFIVGRGKRSVEDHFTADFNFVKYLETKNKDIIATELIKFYKKMTESNIIFINQPEPKGFGDAIYRARAFTLNDPFLVHAGDDLVLSSNESHIRRLTKAFNGMKADATFLIERVEDPTRYGVITGFEIKPGIYKVTDIIEKPKEPPSNIATIAIYIFNEMIYDAIKRTEPDKSHEIQLTDAIKNLILSGGRVYAVSLTPNEKRIEVGTPQSYWNALKYTFERRLK